MFKQYLQFTEHRNGGLYAKRKSHGKPRQSQYLKGKATTMASAILADLSKTLYLRYLREMMG